MRLRVLILIAAILGAFPVRAAVVCNPLPFVTSDVRSVNAAIATIAACLGGNSTTPLLNGGYGDTKVATVTTTIANGSRTLSVGSNTFFPADYDPAHPKQIYIPGAGATSGTVGSLGSIAVSTAGVGYQATPGVPLTASGVILDAEVSAYMKLVSAALATNGSGCTLASQTATLSGGILSPSGTASTVVIAFSAGSATGVSSVSNAGSYAGLPGKVTYTAGVASLGAISVTGTDCSVPPTLTVNDGTHGFGVAAINVNTTGTNTGGLNYPIGATTAALNGGNAVTAATLGTVTITPYIAPLRTTITGYTSATQVTVANAASTAVTAQSESIYYGHDDTAGFQNACAASLSVYVPPAIYQVNNAVIPNGCWLWGYAGNAYTIGYASINVLPYIIAGGAVPAFMFDVDSSFSPSFSGLALDCNGTGASGISANSSKMLIMNTSIINCINGLGGAEVSNTKTNHAKLINDTFQYDQFGVSDLVDTPMIGGILANNQYGWYGGFGAGGAADLIEDVRVEFNTQSGVYAGNVIDLEIHGGLFDRNFVCGITVIGGGSTQNTTTINGVQFRRNGRDYSGAALADAHICASNYENVVITGTTTLTGQDDKTGGGPLSPQYTISYASATPGGPLTVSGNDLTGFTNAVTVNGPPAGLIAIGNQGLGDTDAADVEIFTSSGTWPTHALQFTPTTVEVWAIGPGGSGGGGAMATSGNVAEGGGGGGCGARTHKIFSYALVGPSESVGVGTAPVGGLGATSNGVGAAPLTDGTDSNFGASILTAFHGGNGAGGQTSGDTGGGGGPGLQANGGDAAGASPGSGGTGLGVAGGAGSVGNIGLGAMDFWLGGSGAGPNATTSPNGGIPCGGGAGGTLEAAGPTALAGGNGAIGGSGINASAGGTGGTTGAPGGNATSDSAYNIIPYSSGTGGGGGNTSAGPAVAGAGGTAGTNTYGCGGGGGGGGIGGGGNGGKGCPGFVAVITRK